MQNIVRSTSISGSDANTRFKGDDGSSFIRYALACKPLDDNTVMSFAITESDWKCGIVRDDADPSFTPTIPSSDLACGSSDVTGRLEFMSLRFLGLIAAHMHRLKDVVMVRICADDVVR